MHKSAWHGRVVQEGCMLSLFVEVASPCVVPQSGASLVKRLDWQT